MRFDTGGNRHLRKLDDIRNPVIQINFNGDSIVLGDALALQEVGIGQRQCPGLSFFCLKRDGPLILIDGYDLAPAEYGRRLTSRGSRTDGEENAERQD